MFSRPQLVTVMIAFVAAAAGALGGPIIGAILVAVAVALFVLYLTPFGERVGVIATPRVRFLPEELTGLRKTPAAWGETSARFLCIPVVNERGPDVALFTTLAFTSLDGEPLFDRSFQARWSNSEAPPHMPLGRSLTMRELRSEEIAEAFDVLLIPNEANRLGCYVFNNESWHTGRADDFRIEADEFLVHAEVKGKGVREQGVWCVHASFFPEVERVG